MTEQARAALGDRTLPNVTPGAVFPLEHHRYLVLGNSAWHLVERDHAAACGWWCDCKRYKFWCARYGLECKHIDWLLDWQRRRQATREREMRTLEIGGANV